MHLDDTPIKIVTEIIILGKLLKEIVWSKPARRVGRYLFKKINSVPLEHLFIKKNVKGVRAKFRRKLPPGLQKEHINSRLLHSLEVVRFGTALNSDLQKKLI